MRRQSITTFMARVRCSDGCWEWTGGRDKDGYGKSGLHGRSMRAHRVIWELTYGPAPTGLYVCHTCDNPPCCRPSHLYLGTHRRNTEDAVARERFRLVGRRTLLTEAEIREIRHRYRPYVVSGPQLAREYGVSQSTISHIVRNLVWRDHQ